MRNDLVTDMMMAVAQWYGDLDDSDEYEDRFGEYARVEWEDDNTLSVRHQYNESPKVFITFTLDF